MQGQTTKYTKLTQREHVLARPDTYIGNPRFSVQTRFVAVPSENVHAPLKKQRKKNDIVSQLESASNQNDIGSGLESASNQNDIGSELESASNQNDVGSNVKNESVVSKKSYDNFDIIEKDISYCPGLIQLFLEILNNARDRTVVNGVEVRCNKIDVHVSQETGEISIWNNGDSIPIEMHPKEKIYNPELIFGHLLTSSNYNDSERRIVGGRNGFGAKLTNIYSSRFTVEIVDHKTRQKYIQSWNTNMSVCDPPVIERLSAKNPRPYTKVSWIFDAKRFGKGCIIDQDFMQIIHKCVIDIAATVGNKVTVTFQGKEILTDTLAKYVDAFPLLRTSPSKIHAIVNDRWKISIATVQPTDGYRCISFVNGMYTWMNGTHEQYVVSQVVDIITQTLRTRARGNDKDLIDNARNLNKIIKDRLWVFIDSCIENPEFSSQTKECLKTPRSEWGSTCELPMSFVKKIQSLEIIEQIMDQLKGKSQSALKNTDGRKVNRLMIEKYDSAQWAGTNKSKECFLIVTEGDSAKGTAVSGLKARNDRQRFGIFPLRGKFINTRNASPVELMKNEEFKNLKQILGLQQGKTYETEAERKTLRYGGLIVFTDQDTDGFHIKALLMNMFSTFWPHLLTSGFVHALPTPIVKVTKGKQMIPFYSIPQFKQWEDEQQGNTKGWNIKYYKGLGTSNSQEAQEYFKGFRLTKYVGAENMNTRTSDIQRFFTNTSMSMSDNDGGDHNDHNHNHDHIPTNEIMKKIFDRDESDYRKEWVKTCDRSASVDPTKSEITIQEFINKEYIQHANDNIERTIPNVIDGLKPSQRKIIYGCFQAGLHDLKKEMKVAQLGASVAKDTQYHHGEQSLMSAIVGMAQTFVGSNNINLLYPSGQFGTRLLGGKDAASPRYIFTRLTDVALKVFRKEDNPILEHVIDEGVKVEPSVYIPLIPLVLVNGAEGIGTGFSTNLPPCNPKIVLQTIRTMIHGNNVPHEIYIPFWRNFNGTVRQTDQYRYTIHGKYTCKKDGSIQITELPVGTWTTNYKTFLDQLVLQGKIRDHTCLIDDENVDITVYQNNPPEEISDIDRAIEEANEFLGNVSEKRKRSSPEQHQTIERADIENTLKLVTKVNTSNIYLYTSPFEKQRSCIQKYNSVEQIYQEFFQVRKRAYELRKQYQLDHLSKEYNVAREKSRFIQLQISGQIQIVGVDDSVITEMLNCHSFSEDLHDILLNMKISNFTKQKAEAQERIANELAVEIENLKSTSIETIWLRELDELEMIL